MFQKILQLIVLKKSRIKRSCKIFSVVFNPIDNNDVLDIHIYLMKRTRYKIIFVLIKKILLLSFIVIIGLLSSINNVFDHTKCVLLSNQKCMFQPTLIYLHRNEYSQKCHYYPFVVKLDICVGSYNTLNDLSNNVC